MGWEGDAPSCPPGYDAFQLVMSFAVVCGVLWILAGGISFWAYVNTKKMWALTSAFIYLVGYLIFIGLFGPVIAQINLRNSDFSDNICDSVKKKMRRSGDEFMAYSICGFVLIGTSIICTFASAFSL